MKKLLLSSIIMFGVCSFVNAQNAPASNIKKPGATTTTAATPTPQKAAVVSPSATTDVEPARPASDKNTSAAPAAANVMSAKVKPAQASTVGADGVIISAPDAAKEKAAAAKANDLKKNKDN